MEPSTVLTQPTQELLDAIDTAICEYKKSTGRDCFSIYLGVSQMLTLRKFANDAFHYKSTPSLTDSEYCGRKVYEVKCDSHLAVA